jgi:hypothetical protein
MTPCSPLKFNTCFGLTCRLHLRGWRVSQARNQHEALFLHTDTLLDFIFNLADGRRHVPPKLRRLQRTTRRYIPDDKTRITSAIYQTAFRETPVSCATRRVHIASAAAVRLLRECNCYPQTAVYQCKPMRVGLHPTWIPMLIFPRCS